MHNATAYSEKDLRRIAREAIRDESKAANVKARFAGFELRLQPHSVPGAVSVVLVAYGMRPDCTEFDVNVAI
jgi:hypothetical protein